MTARPGRGGPVPGAGSAGDAWAVEPPRPPLRHGDGLVALTAGEIAALVADRTVSAVAVVEAHLERIVARDPWLQALAGVAADRARADAAAVDAAVEQALARGERPGPLVGVPFVVKDNVDVAGEVTACGSRAHDGLPAAADAPVVARLRAAGAVLLGRATMDELAMGAATTTCATGPAFNPWQQAHSPGGSSGGCAAAVAAGLAPLSVGTDTGGSIREPASQCGVTGIAPTPGLVPLEGVVPFATGFDRVGPLARDPDDTALALAVMADTLPRAPAAPVDLRDLRIGVVRELAGDPNRAGVLAVHAAVVERLRAAGASLVEASLPDARLALRVYSSLTAVAAIEHVGRFVATGRAGEEVQRRHHLGRALRADRDRLADAEQARARLRTQVGDALARCDLLLSPTMPTTAPRLDQVAGRILADPLSAPYTDCWTVIANLVGAPAVSFPAGTAPDDRMPVGAMLTGAPGSDDRLLAVAAALARPLPW